MDNELDVFGKKFVEEVYDYALVDWQGIVSGKAKRGVLADSFKEHFGENLNQSEKERLLWLISEVIETTMFYELNFFEQNPDYLLSTSDEESVNLTSISDGLAGELVSDQGWIARYAGK